LCRNSPYWQRCRKERSSSGVGKKYQQQRGNIAELRDKAGSGKGGEEVTISY